MNSVAAAIGWSVVHSLWQGAVAALALGAVLFVTRSARARYAAACLALALMCIGFGATLWRSLPAGIAGSVVVIRAEAPLARDLGNGPALRNRAEFASKAMPWIAAIWAAGVLVFQLRAVASWRAARRLRFTAVCAPPTPWQERMDALRARICVTRAVKLLESGLAEAPAVVGHLRPVILMPVGLVAGLPVGQVEAILLHELAHIRRGDYLINVLQSVAEGIFFYHPATWWISAAVRREREHCCDDLVVATQGDAHCYASALAALEQSRWSADPAVAATGGNLVRRIRRLLNHPEGPRPSFAPVLPATLLLVIAAATLLAWQPRPNNIAVVPLQVWTGTRLTTGAITMAPQVRGVQPKMAVLRVPYMKWVNEDVTYIIDDRERATFVSLQSDPEREKFIEQFWKRRDPTPNTVENEFKEEHYRRIAYSNERFAAGIPGWKTDRGRVYVVYGPPDEIEAHPSGDRTGTTYPYEEWLYRRIEGRGDNVIFRFEDSSRSGEYRLVRK